MSIRRVAIIQTERAVPTFHEFGGGRWDVDRMRTVVSTACGIDWPEAPYWSAGLRLDHAQLFARPCARCYTTVASGA